MVNERGKRVIGNLRVVGRRLWTGYCLGFKEIGNRK